MTMHMVVTLVRLDDRRFSKTDRFRPGRCGALARSSRASSPAPGAAARTEPSSPGRRRWMRVPDPVQVASVSVKIDCRALGEPTYGAFSPLTRRVRRVTTTTLAAATFPVRRS